MLGAAIAVAPVMTANAEENISLLFVEMSPSVTMADGILTLEQTDDEMIWFSDRPQRVAGKISTADFLSAWEQGADSFASDPPNATLFGNTEAGEVATVVTVSNARETEAGIAFDYVVLEGEEHGTWSDVALFIDSTFSKLFTVKHKY